jgi:hypothetical protein
MAKATLINGQLFVDYKPPRVIRVFVPSHIIDRYREIVQKLNNGTYTQAQADDLHRSGIMPFVKLPHNHNPETDIVELATKKTPRSILTLK